MSLYVGAVIAFAAAIAQATVLVDFRLAGIHPDLVVLAVAGWAALHRLREGIVWAGLGGIAMDLLSAAPLGSTVVALGLAALVGGAIGRRVRPTNPLLAAAGVPFAVAAYYAASLIICLRDTEPGSVLNLATDAAAPAILLDSLVGGPALLLLLWLSRAIARSRWGAA